MLSNETPMSLLPDWREMRAWHLGRSSLGVV
jgi:hypothetical protein